MVGFSVKPIRCENEKECEMRGCVCDGETLKQCLLASKYEARV